MPNWCVGRNLLYTTHHSPCIENFSPRPNGYLSKMKIAFFSTKSYDRQFFDLYAATHEIIYFEARLTHQTVNLASGCNAVCVFVNDKLSANVIGELKKMNVQLIALRSAGFNNVDLAAAKENAIPVVRVPDYSPYAVAEHAVALILTLNRKTHKAYNRVREGNFSLERLTGFDLHGKTVGVIGTGKIGQVFCDIMLGFGCKVLAFDLIAHQPTVAKGVEYLPLTDILQQADIISLHCPLNEQTKHIINDQTIAIMKKGVMLINTSRGALINTIAAINGLKTGSIGYLGLDVYEQESKLFFNDLSENIIQDDDILRLISFPNVLITAHQGFFTEEALTQIAAITMQNIADFEAGILLKNRVV
ncbi:MAG: D-lactate dehydrogenase [Ferruginibacter sp.]|nr:D-lactate dehydrogenase [Ferruginibacter sp.]